LVLLHGIGHRWQCWLPVMARLARQHDVIAIDLPGFGRSAAPAGGPARDVASLVASVLSELEALGLDRPHVAGNSLGGAVALELAALGAVATATALSPAGFQTASEGRRAMFLLGAVRATVSVPEPVLRRAISRRWIRDLGLRGLVEAPDRLDADRVLGDCLALHQAPGYWPMAWGLRRYVFAPLVEPAVPVTVAWASRDRILRPWQADRARLRLPQARHVSLPHCGHVPMSDDPATVARVILQTTGAAAAVDQK
jgi:pimeloyl-ACP methyl ester carboxylesterase